MTDLLQVVVLSIVQGLTEFLPVSSSAHLIVVPKLFGWSDQGLFFDVALHFGTLLAVLAYFRADLKTIATDLYKWIYSRKLTPHGHLGIQMGLATIPVGITGLLLHDAIETHLRSPIVVGITAISFGLILYASDLRAKTATAQVGYRQAILIGFAQILALIPGTSRSGITLTAGLALGLNRHLAARFSFLISIPLMLSATLFEVLKVKTEVMPFSWVELSLGVALSALCAFACIHYFLKLIERLGVGPFVIYRVLLGLFLLTLFY